MTKSYRAPKPTLQKGVVSLVCKSDEHEENQVVITCSFSLCSSKSYNFTALYRGVEVSLAPETSETAETAAAQPTGNRGPAPDPSGTKSRILAHLADAGWFLSPGEIAAAIGVNRNAVDQTLFRMLRDNEIVKAGRGRYGLPGAMRSAVQ